MHCFRLQYLFPGLSPCNFTLNYNKYQARLVKLWSAFPLKTESMMLGYWEHLKNVRKSDGHSDQNFSELSTVIGVWHWQSAMLAGQPGLMFWDGCLTESNSVVSLVLVGYLNCSPTAVFGFLTETAGLPKLSAWPLYNPLFTLVYQHDPLCKNFFRTGVRRQSRQGLVINGEVWTGLGSK